MVLVELKTPTWLTHSTKLKLQVDFPILTSLDRSYLDHRMPGLGYLSLRQAILLPDDGFSSPLWSLTVMECSGTVKIFLNAAAIVKF